MKKAKIIFKIFFICLIISCCKDDNIDGVQVKFYNETGLSIDELNIGNMGIGTLEIGASSEYILYEIFRFDTGQPSEHCIGIIANETIESYGGFYWCGTEQIYITNGVYEMTIELIEVDAIEYLSVNIK